MRRPRITVDATVLATAIWIDAERERDVRRIVFRNDALDPLCRHDGLGLTRFIRRRYIPAVVERFPQRFLEPALGIERGTPAFVSGAVISGDGSERHTGYLTSIWLGWEARREGTEVRDPRFELYPYSPLVPRPSYLTLQPHHPQRRLAELGLRIGKRIQNGEVVIVWAGNVSGDDTRPLVCNQRVLLLEAAQFAPADGNMEGRPGGRRHQCRTHLLRGGLGQAQVCIDRRRKRDRPQVVDATDGESALHDFLRQPP